jgi:MFS family permease
MNETMNSDRGGAVYVTLVCLVAALGGLLFGYDTAVIAGAIGFLQEHFGLSATVKSWAAACALLGCVAGVSFAGPFSDRLGRKKTLLLAGLLFLGSAIGTALPQSFAAFVIFRILGGVGVGVASMTSPIYIAEISPARIRGRMVSVNQFAIVSGMLIIYFVNYFIARQGDAAWNRDVGWRWMFASGVLPSALFLLLLMLVPESPRWLVEAGRVRQAYDILAKVDGREHAAAEIAAIQEAVAAETGSLAELFQPGLRRPLTIGVALAVLQQVTGINVFLYFGTEIFRQLDSSLDTTLSHTALSGGGLGRLFKVIAVWIFKQLHSAGDPALLQMVVVGSVNLLFTIVAIWTVDQLGRKPLMLVGAAGMGLCLVAIGAAAQAGAIAVWVLVFVLGYIACFALSVGPVTWVLLSEIFPTRIRGRALAVATFCLWSANFVISQTFLMMDENKWLLAKFNHGFPFYVYAIFCVVLVIVVWRLVPETKGRSLEEIERSWRKV